jgi:hypothetical protein
MVQISSVISAIERTWRDRERIVTRIGEDRLSGFRSPRRIEPYAEGGSPKT